MTCAWLPRPRARPRTKVVLPAPSGPSRRSRSPRRRCAARRAAAASVSSGEWVTISAEVVVAALALLAVDQDPAVPGERPDDREGAGDGTAAHQLDLLAPDQGLLEGGAGGHRDKPGVDAGADAGGGPELGQLAQQAVADVPAGTPRRQLHEARPGAARPPRREGGRLAPQRPADPD